MEARLIDIKEFKYAGEGANGESYNHCSDSTLMLKLYFPIMDRKAIEIEVQRAQDVFQAGIASPQPGDFVTDGNGRYGILFRRLPGKVSYARAAGNNPENLDQLAREFAKLCRELHCVEVDTTKFPSVKKQYLDMLEANPYCSKEEKDYLRNVICSTPDCATAIHGDMHFGNALIVGEDRYWIDLGEFAYGYHLFDMGMMMICCLWSDEEFIFENFHMHSNETERFFKTFIVEYFDGKYSYEQAVEIVKPFAAVKCLLVSRNMSARFPIMHEKLAELMQRNR